MQIRDNYGNVIHEVKKDYELVQDMMTGGYYVNMNNNGKRIIIAKFTSCDLTEKMNYKFALVFWDNL